MKTQDTKSLPENVIDATAALKPKPRIRVLKAPKLSPEEAAAVDRYIAARRKEQAGKAAADALKPVILAIVQPRGQVARRGALVSLDKSYSYHYSAAVAVLSKTLSDTRATERETGLAKAVVTETVAFEDVRRRDTERRNKMAV